VGEAIQPLKNDEFWREVWSWPVVNRLLDSQGDVEQALSGIEDEELAGEVRAAVMESHGAISMEYAISSIYKLYDAHLIRRLREVQEQLSSYKSERAPVELLAKCQEIMSERNRIRKGIVS
jgi:hypothetical protein